MPNAGATTDFFGGADSSTEIVLDDIKCLGNESNLLECSRIGSNIQEHNCKHSEDAGVVCQSTFKTVPTVTTLITQLHMHTCMYLHVDVGVLSYDFYHTIFTTR